MPELDVVVVGAGVSGLTTARRLAEAGANVLVVEARSRVGGRTLSEPLAGDTIDLGGQWFGYGQHRGYRLARELGLRTFRQYDKGRKIIDLGGRLDTYSSPVPKLPVFQQLSLGVGIARAERNLRRLSPKFPFARQRAERWDAMSVEQWLTRRIRGRDAQTIFRIGTEMIFAEEPSALSLLYFFHYLRSGSGLLRMLSIRGGAQQDRVIGGMQQLSARMAEELGGRVRLGEPARSVEQQGGEVRVGTDRDRYSARYAVIAMAPALCSRIEFSPALSAKRRELERSMPMGAVVKCIAAYEKAFWRERGLSGEAISDGWPVRAVFDDTSHDDAHPALVAFIVGDTAREVSEMNAAARRRVVLDALGRLFGDAAREPAAYVDKAWPKDEWSDGCYTGVFPPGVMTRVGDTLRLPQGRIYFAGTEAAVLGMGYVDGAIDAAERTAEAIIGKLGA